MLPNRFESELSSKVSLGLMIYEKIWFLRPNCMRLDDVPSYIKEKYLRPSSSFDGVYIDADNPLVQLWAKQVVGNETNPYFVARLLFQNLTETLERAKEYEQFQLANEYASATLTSRKGVCRHFARAYAALSIAAKLPVRTVLGTAFGLINETYKKNHEWNEVYFPKYGGVAVDVTWERFGLLSNAHSAYTYWEYDAGTLEVSYVKDSDSLALVDQSKRVLRKLITISKGKLDGLKSFKKITAEFYDEVEKLENLLNYAQMLIGYGNVHESLLLISEANLIIKDLQERIETKMGPLLDESLLIYTIVSTLSGLLVALIAVWVSQKWSDNRKFKSMVNVLEDEIDDHFQLLKYLNTEIAFELKAIKEGQVFMCAFTTQLGLLLRQVVF